MTALALNASKGPRKSDCFVPVTFSYVDGFEILIHDVPKAVAESSKLILLDEIQTNLSEMIIKNMMFMTRGEKTFIWVTLNPETSRLTPRTMTELKSIVSAMQLHAYTFWCLERENGRVFELSKIDIAIDLEGSFITHQDLKSYNSVKKILTDQIQFILKYPETNFLSCIPVSDF